MFENKQTLLARCLWLVPLCK